MPTPTYSDILAFSQQVQQVSNEAANAFLVAAREVDFTDWTRAAEMLRQIVESIVDYYGLATSELGAQWYEYCRGLSVGGDYTATVQVPNTASAVAAANREIDKLFDGKVDTNKLVSLLHDVVTDQVYSQSRDIIIVNILDDDVGGDKNGYARVPVGDTCAFCIMLASRGFVYASKRSATYTKEGEKYHPNCNCVAVPFHKAQSIPGYQDILDKYDKMYRDADNARRSGDIPDELKTHIRETKKEHNAKHEAYLRGELPNGPREPWRSFNEITMIMRWQNEGLH